jgi:hypothetical protein
MPDNSMVYGQVPRSDVLIRRLLDEVSNDPNLAKKVYAKLLVLAGRVITFIQPPLGQENNFINPDRLVWTFAEIIDALPESKPDRQDDDNSDDTAAEMDAGDPSLAEIIDALLENVPGDKADDKSTNLSAEMDGHDLTVAILKVLAGSDEAWPYVAASWHRFLSEATAA